MAKTNQGTPGYTKTMVTVLVLGFAFPVGIILMWFWTKWPLWVKILISVLLIIPILLLIESVALIGGINPARQFAEADNTVRGRMVREILSAVRQYAIEHNGAFPPGMPTGANTEDISTGVGGTGATFCNALVPSYVAKLPADPKTGFYKDCNSYDTRYAISVNSAGNRVPQVTISAPDAELGTVISVTR